MYPRGRCYISHPKRVIFIPTYKVATNAIVDCFELTNSMNFQWKFAKAYNVFAVVRHPVPRFISAVSMFLADPAIHKEGRATDPSTPEIRAVYNLSTVADQFLRFLEMSEQAYPGAIDTHFRSQMACLYQENLKVLPVDTLLRLEDLTPWAARTYGVTVPTMFSGDPGIKEEIKGTFDKRITDRIESLYQTDLELYEDICNGALEPLVGYVETEENRRTDAAS